MSYVADDQDDEEQSQNSQTQAPANQSAVSLGGGGSGVAAPGGGNVGAGGQQPQAPKAQTPSSSGSWTNLQSYLNANQDQAAAAGTQIANTVGNEAQTAQNDINSAASDFTNNVNADTVQQNSGEVNQAIQDAEDTTAGSTFNPSDVTNYQAQADAAYNGPTDFSQDQNYSNAQSAANTATNALTETQSEAGRDVLLNNEYSGASANGYNQGEQNLDQALIEGNPTSQAAFQNVNNQWSGIGNVLGTTTANEDALVTNATSTDAATAAAAEAAYNAANTNWQSGVNTQYQNDLTNYNNVDSSAAANLAANNITAAQAKAFGLTSGLQTYGADLANYLEPGVAPTLADTATADQYAQAQALAQLAGTVGGSTFLPEAEATEAGTSTPDTFNLSKLQSDLGTDQAEFQENYNSQWNNPQIGQQVVGAALGVNANSGSLASYQSQYQDYVNSIDSLQQQGYPPGYMQGPEYQQAKAALAAINSWAQAHQYNLGDLTVGS